MASPAWFPLRRKGASLASTAQADYAIIDGSKLSNSQAAALASSKGIAIKGRTYTLAQPLPAGATGFSSQQGAADYLLQQTPGLASASWTRKYTGALWERIVAGVVTVVALGASGDGGDDDPGNADDPGSDDDGKDEGKSDDEPGDEPEPDSSDGLDEALTGTALAAILGSFFQGNIWTRAAKIIIGGALVVVGVSKLTGIDKQVAVLGKAVAAAPLL